MGYNNSQPPPTPTKYPYYSPPPPLKQDCNMTVPKYLSPPPLPPPPLKPDCNMTAPKGPRPPPSSPPPCVPCTCPPYQSPPPPYYPPPIPPPPPPPYIVKHDYKAVIAVSASLGGILVGFLAFAVFFLAWTRKKPVIVPPLSPPSYHQYGQQTETETCEDIEILREGDGGGGPSCEQGGPAPVPHDTGRNNYG